MASGFIAINGVDTDTIFAPYSSGTKPALTGFRDSSGVDFRDKYQPYTSGSKADLTGFRTSDGNDIREIFAIPSSGGPVASPTYGGMTASYTTTGTVGPKTATVTLTINTDGTAARTGAGSSGALPVINNNWYLPTTGGIGAQYQIRFTWTLTGSSGFTDTINNGASSFTTLSGSFAFTASCSTSAAVISDGQLTGTLLVEIRRVSDSVVVSSKSLSVSAGIFHT